MEADLKQPIDREPTREDCIARSLLQSPDFFDAIASVLDGAGVNVTETDFALGLYIVSISALLPNPLRLWIIEKKPGDAGYLMSKVEQLLPRGSVQLLRVANDQHWTEVKRCSEHRIVWIPKWEVKGGGKLELMFNELSRVLPGRRDMEDVVTGPFAIVTTAKPPDDETGWLKMELPEISRPEQQVTGLTEFDKSIWRCIHDLLACRAKVQFKEPGWGSRIEEQLTLKGYSPRLSTVFDLWKTICLLRSFLAPFGEEMTETPLVVSPSFEDYAAAEVLARDLFSQKGLFPPAEKLFNEIFPKWKITGLVHPLTGQKIVYTKPDVGNLSWDPPITRPKS